MCVAYTERLSNLKRHTGNIRRSFDLGDSDVKDLDTDNADGKDETTEQKDQYDADSFAHGHMEAPHHRNGEGEHHGVSEQICYGTGCIERSDLDTSPRCGLCKRAKPERVDRCALEYGAKQVSDSPDEDYAYPDRVDFVEVGVVEDPPIQ